MTEILVVPENLYRSIFQRTPAYGLVHHTNWSSRLGNVASRVFWTCRVEGLLVLQKAASKDRFYLTLDHGH